MVRFYDRTLSFVLEHRALTLLVFVATIALTVGLYIRTPKGYFPQDDTGLIFGGTEASTDISFDAMKKLQLKAMDVVLADPAVGGPRLLGRRVLLQRLGQSRPHVHQPEAARASAAMCSTQAVVARLRAQAQQHPRHPRVHGAGAGPARRRPAEQLAISVHAVERGHRRVADLGAEGARPGEAGAGHRRRHHRPRAGRLAGQCRHRPPGGRAPRRAHPGHRQRAQRRLLAAADFDHLHPAQPISRHPGSRPANTSATRPTSSQIYVPAAATTQVPLSAVAHVERGIAPLVVNHQGQFPSTTITYNLAPGTTIEDAHRGDRAGGGRNAHSRHDPRRLRRRRAGLQAERRRAAAAAAGGADRGLYRARRAVREPGAPAHHHLDAAVGGPRRAAGAADLPAPN